MKRREALKKTTWILKATLFSPAIMQVLQACREKPLPAGELFILTPQQDVLVQALSDTIIPSTNTPGATEVGVHRFMDLLLRDVFEEADVQRLLQGLQDFEGDCMKETGSSFVALPQEERQKYLQTVDQNVMAQQYQESVPFYFTFKHLTTVIYFSSEEGVKQNLTYIPVPGPYQGVVALKPGDTIQAGNHM